MKSTSKNIFGERVKLILKQKYISQKRLSEDTGINYNTLNLYLNQPVSPALKTLFCIAEYLNVSVDYLIGLVDDYRPIRKDQLDTYTEEMQIIRKACTKMNNERKKAIIQLVSVFAS